MQPGVKKIVYSLIRASLCRNSRWQSGQHRMTGALSEFHLRASSCYHSRPAEIALRPPMQGYAARRENPEKSNSRQGLTH